MSLSIRSKKIVASVMALSLVSSGVIASEGSVISKFVSPNSISASAAVVYGDWEYEVGSGSYEPVFIVDHSNAAEVEGFQGH